PEIAESAGAPAAAQQPHESIGQSGDVEICDAVVAELRVREPTDRRDVNGPAVALRPLPPHRPPPQVERGSGDHSHSSVEGEAPMSASSSASCRSRFMPLTFSSVARRTFMFAAIAAAALLTALRELEQMCARDHGRMWGVSLCGPTLFVDPQTREVTGNQPTP